MNEIASKTRTQAQANPLLTSSNLLQRKCACGVHTVAGSECTECAKSKIGLQRKLTIGASNDPLEQEADRIADQVMSMPANSTINSTPLQIQRFTGSSAIGPSAGRIDEAPPSVDRVLASSGMPLEPALRQDMEQHFGHDFSRVRIHSDASAAGSAREVGANAYTVGHNVVFGARRFAPDTQEGRRLMAHELAHVVQQTGVGRAALGQVNEKSRLSNISSGTALYLARSVDEWLLGSINVSTMSYTEIIYEMDELSQWMQRQIASSDETVRIEEALTLLRNEVQRREAATRAHERKRRRGLDRSTTSDTDSTTRRPQALIEMSSVAYENSNEMRAEFDLIMDWLARDDISAHERQILAVERDNLSPQLRQDRERVGIQRHRARLATVLSPSEQGLSDTIEQQARIIQGIVPDPENNHLSYIYQGHERITISSQQAEQLRTALTDQLQDVHRRIESRVSYYWGRYRSQLAINRDSPIIAAISGFLGDVEDPGEELIRRTFWVRSRLGNLEIYAREGRFVEAAAILAPVERASQEIRALSRAFYEGYISGAETSVGVLEFTRDASFTIAGSIAAVVAAPVVAGYVAGTGATGITAGILTTGGTGLAVGTGTAAVRGTSAAGGELAAGSSWDEVSEAFRIQAIRGFREGFINGAAGGAARVLGPALGVGAAGASGAPLAYQALRRIAAEAIVNGTSAMVETLWRGGTVEEAVSAGLQSAALSAPGALVGGANSPLVRELGGPLMTGASAYIGAIASGAPPQEAMRSAGVAVTTSIVMNRASHGSAVDTASEARGREMGARARRRATGIGAAVLIGTADALPPVRSGYGGTSATPVTGASHDTETVAATPRQSHIPGSTAAASITASQPGETPTATTVASETVASPVPVVPHLSETTMPAAMPDSIPTAPNSMPATAGAEIPSVLSPSERTPMDPEEAWSQLREEMGNRSSQPAPSGSVGSRIETSARLAEEAGWLDVRGNPQGVVHAAVGEHGHAPQIRGATSHTGRTRQSAHIGATSLLRTIAGYSRRAALTLQLAPAMHRAFDQHWMRWVSNRRRAIRAFGSSDFTAPLSDVLDAQRQAIRQTPGLTAEQRSTFEWLLEREIHTLASGLPNGMATRVPLPAILGS